MEKHFTKTVLLAFCLFLSFSAKAETFVSGNITYSILSEAELTVRVVQSQSAPYAGAINIPSSVNYNNKNYTVAAIGYRAFLSCTSLWSITIPNSVINISHSAFAGCSGLNSITIPNSVATIGEAAFFECSRLGSIIIPNSVATIDNRVFAYCSGLTSITIPNSVTTIGEYAFYDCGKLTSIAIPNSVITIGEKAFDRCSSLTSITIPNSVTTIGLLAFRHCIGLTRFIVSKDNAIYCDVDGVLCSKDKTNLITYPNSKDTRYTTPYSVTKISPYAFMWCTNLSSITISSSVTEIGIGAFNDCELTFLTIGDNVTQTAGAFDYCNVSAFVNCYNPNPSNDGHFPLKVYSEATLNIPKGSLAAYRKAEGWKQFVKISEEFSGVEGVISDAVKVVANGGDINVIGAEENTPIEVYTLNGQLVYSGTSATIHIPTAGLYIARIAEKSYKVIITKR